jgi:HEAT repeat protein
MFSTPTSELSISRSTSSTSSHSSIINSNAFDEYGLTSDELEDVKNILDVMVNHMKIIHKNALRYCHILIKDHSIIRLEDLLLMYEMKGEVFLESITSSTEIDLYKMKKYITTNVTLSGNKRKCSPNDGNVNHDESNITKRARQDTRISAIVCSPDTLHSNEDQLLGLQHIVQGSDVPELLFLLKHSSSKEIVLGIAKRFETLLNEGDESALADLHIHTEIRNQSGIFIIVKSLNKFYNDSIIMQQLLVVLRLLARNKMNQDSIRSEGGMARLVELLRDSDENVRKNALEALDVATTDNNTNKDTVRELGGILRIVELFDEKDIEVRKRTARVLLLNLGINNVSNKNAIHEVGGITKLIECLNDGDEKLKRLVLCGIIANLVGKKENIYCKAIHEGGGILKLIELLSRDSDAEVRANVLHLLLKLSISGDICRHAIREADGIVRFVELLKDDNIDVRIQALSLLSILAGHEDSSRIAIHEANGIVHLVELLNGSDKMREGASMALGFLAANATIQNTIRNAGGIVKLIELLSDSHVKVRTKAANALAEVVVNNQVNQDFVREAGGIPVLVKLLEGENAELRVHAAVGLGNLANNNDINRISIREANAIPILVKLLKDNDARKPAAGALWNLSYENSNKDAIREADGISSLIEILKDHDNDAKEQVAGALRYLAYDNENNQRKICIFDGIRLLIDLLKEDDDKAREHAVYALYYTLSCKYNISQSHYVSTGIGRLKKLSKDKDADIRSHAIRVLQKLNIKLN